MKKIVEAKYTSLRFDDKVLETKEMDMDCAGPDVSSTVTEIAKHMG